MRHTRRGFTVMEMMVVVTISLAMMLLIVPIFQVTTRTVKTVERKLALYEAARNILDLISLDVAQAVLNERSEPFSIKSLTYTDTDPLTDPGNLAVAADRYGRTSRREADSVNYCKLQGGAFRFAQNLLQPGSMAFPLGYPEIVTRYPEAWKCSLRTSLSYYNMSNVVSTGSEMTSWSRVQQLADVTLINMQVICHAHTGLFRPSNNCYDAIPNSMAPGYEMKEDSGVPDDPPLETRGVSGNDNMRSSNRHLGGLRVMDLDVAYWDDVDKKFKDPPDDTTLYFWPAPKAIRITITVCDLAKRGTLTLARVVQIPVGYGRCGDKALDAALGDLTLNPRASSDTTQLDLDTQPFNRTKKAGITANEVAILNKP